MNDPTGNPAARPDPSKTPAAETSSPAASGSSLEGSRTASLIPSASASGSGGEPAGVSGTAAPAGSKWIGKRVGNFRILSFIGRGAMGRVFRAEDRQLKRHVALKVFPTVVDQGKRRVRLERFIREAQSTAALEHPGIVRVYEAGEFNGWYFIAMELIEGASVGRMIDASGPLDVARACQLIAEVAEALEYAHDHGIIHRDVKPDNILIGRGGRVKLADFGLAYRSDPADRFHVLNEAVGTAFYMAPEICKGQDATPLADQYSLAGTLWTLLIGKPPFAGKTRDDLFRHQVNTPLPKLAGLRPDLPAGLVKAIEKALSKDPADRYLSCDQFAKVIRVYTIAPNVSASTPAMSTVDAAAPIAPAPTVAPTVAPAAPAKSRAPIWITAGVTAAAAVAVVAFVATRGGKPTSTPPTVAANPTPAAPLVPTVAPAPAAKDATFSFARFNANDRGPFRGVPTLSGSTIGILKTSAASLVRDDARGLVLQFSLRDDPKMQTRLDGTEGWFMRYVTGAKGNRDENQPRPTRGHVGFWAKTTAPGLQCSIALDNVKDVTADRGRPKAMIADGQWHAYAWDLSKNADWEPYFAGDGKIDGPDFTIDSLQFWGPNADAVVLVDDVTHNPDGPLEPPAK